MDTSSITSLALTNLTSVPVLAFVLGLLAARLKTDLHLPDAVYQAITIYLLLAIGLKGGVALRSAALSDVAGPIAMAIGLGIVIPCLAFIVLRLMTKLGPIDRGAMAAHYGSTSLVTFTACLVFLESASISYEGFMPTLLTIMEIPGIIVGLLLAQRSLDHHPRWEESIKEVVTSKSIVLLTGGLVIGFVTSQSGYMKVEPFFGALFTGFLALFLLEMGVVVGARLTDLKKAGYGLFGFALIFPVFAGALGSIAGTFVGLSIGGATVLAVLCASASYIAAPAAVRLALPKANPTLTISTSLGITFPFNLAVGIPIYLIFSQLSNNLIGN